MEDDATGLMLAEEVLGRAGFQVQTFLDASSALSKLEWPIEMGTVEPEWPDIIVTDLMMPGMSGFELCAKVRSNPRGRTVPILVATSLEDVESIDRAYVAGATGFATKPLNWTIEIHRLRYMIRATEVALAAGRADYLTKTIDPQCVVRTLARWKSKTP